MSDIYSNRISEYAVITYYTVVAGNPVQPFHNR